MIVYIVNRSQKNSILTEMSQLPVNNICSARPNGRDLTYRVVPPSIETQPFTRILYNRTLSENKLPFYENMMAENSGFLHKCQVVIIQPIF